MTSSRMLLMASICVVASGCSSKGPITSKRDALQPKLETLREARKTAAAFNGTTFTAPAEAPVISVKAPYDDSNTLVISDAEIDSFDKRADCATLRKDKTGYQCGLEVGYTAGNQCAAEVASVLKFDHFRNDKDTHLRDNVAKCVEWMQKMKYVVVVHVDTESFELSTVEARARGSAVLVELASKKALGKVTFDERSHEKLGGTTYTADGKEAAYVTENANSFGSLLRNSLAEQLVKGSPKVNVDGYVLH